MILLINALCTRDGLVGRRGSDQSTSDLFLHLCYARPQSAAHQVVVYPFAAAVSCLDGASIGETGQQQDPCCAALRKATQTVSRNFGLGKNLRWPLQTQVYCSKRVFKSGLFEFFLI